MLDYRLLTFIKLYRELNYTKTGQLLHISQPAVSHHIRYLEDYYGIKLFEYQGKSLRPTPQGHKLYDYALTMKVNSEKIKSLIADEDEISLDFGTTLSLGEFTMTHRLIRLLEDFPAIKLSMDVSNTGVLLDKLQRGELDFVLLEGHFDKSSYKSKLLSVEDYIGICSKDNPLSKGEVELLDILEERLILREKGSGTRDIFEQLLYSYNLTTSSFKNFIEIGNIAAIKNLVAANRGISFIYKAAVKKELKVGQLKEIKIKDFKIKREFNFVYLKEGLEEDKLLEWYHYLLEN